MQKTGSIPGSTVKRALSLEQKGIDYIPPSERHGRPNTLLTFWFASNVQLSLLPVGAIAAVEGLDVKWAIIAILVGNGIGALFMAYHSVQGPRMGVAQMVQSRAQFGTWGALVPLLVVLLVYLGYFIDGDILAGDAVSSLLKVSITVGIIIASILTLLITWVGYDLFHGYDRVVAILSGCAFLAVTIRIAQRGATAVVHVPPVTAAHILVVISVAAAGQITWAPYVSDYSRYLPENVSSSKVFWYTFLGSALGGGWVTVLGGVAAVMFGQAIFNNIPGYFSQMFPAVVWLLLIIFILGAFAGNFINLYGSFLTVLTGISPSGRILPAVVTRILFSTIAALLGTIIAIEASAHLLTLMGNFLLLMLYFLVPWTAINLTDFYLVRRGKYAIAELFKENGIYGRFNWWTLGVYFATVGLEVPFVNTTYFEGPVARMLGGADISWIVGFVFAAVVYYVVRRVVPEGGFSTGRQVALASGADAESALGPGE